MLRRAMMAGGGGGGGTDPHWASVVALLHFDGANGSQAFIDETGRAWAVGVGGPELTTSSPRFGTACLNPSFSGSVVAAASSDFDFGNGDFTLEMFVKPVNVASTNNYLFDQNYNQAAFFYNPATGAVAYFANAYRINGGTTPFVLDQWVHLALCRHGSNLRVFRDGVLYVSTTTAVSFGNGIQQPRIGYHGNIGTQGSHIDELRITKGVARYIEDFTPPSAPFPSG